MENQIIVRFELGTVNHNVYIFTEESEVTPICEVVNADNIMSVIAMSAAKYNIRKIKLSGTKDFVMGMKDQLTEKICTCFGKADDFVIELI